MYSWDETSERPTSVIASLETADDDGVPIDMRNLVQDITIKLPQRTQQTTLQQQQFTLDFSRTAYHKVNVNYSDITLTIDIKPTDSTTTLLVAVKYGERPTKHQDYNYVLPVNRSREPYRVRIASRPGVYLIGVRVALFNALSYKPKISYTVHIVASGCLFWSEEQTKWISDGCKASRM